MYAFHYIYKLFERFIRHAGVKVIPIRPDGFQKGYFFDRFLGFGHTKTFKPRSLIIPKYAELVAG
jgi:hypothetical protein